MTARPGDGLPNEPWLAGRVVDTNGRGIPGAAVEAGVFRGESPHSLTKRALVQSTVTDANGQFAFREELDFGEPLEAFPPAELHSLIVAGKAGYVPARRHIDFQSHAGRLEMVLEEPAIVSGRVIWKGSDEPIDRVRVVCRPFADLFFPEEVADEDGSDDGGRFIITVAAEGPAQVRPQFYGLCRGSRVTLVPGKELSNVILEVGLDSETVIEGSVTNVKSGPVPGAQVMLSTDKRVGFPIRTQGDGRYRLLVPKDWPYQSYFIENWPERPMVSIGYKGRDLIARPSGKGAKVAWVPPSHAPPERLLAYHPTYGLATVEVPLLSPGQIRQHVDIVLPEASAVSGKVTDDNLQPIKGAKIAIEIIAEEGGGLIENDNRLARSIKVVSAENGGFEICFLPEGTYELTASHEDYEPLTKRLQLQPHRPVEELDFLLVRRLGFIRGRVLDTYGNPWTDGQVKASTGDYLDILTRYVAAISQDGAYELSSLKPEKYNIWLDLGSKVTEPEGIVWANALRNVPTGTEGANITIMEVPAGALRVQVYDQSRQPVHRFRLLCCPLDLAHGSNGIALEPLADKAVVRSDKGLYVRQGVGMSYSRDARYTGVVLHNRDVVSDRGEFVFDKVAPGSYFVSVQSNEYGEESQEVKIILGEETVASFVLKRRGRLNGVVLDYGRQPVKGVRVSAVKTQELMNRCDLVKLHGRVIEWDTLYGGEKTRSGEDGRFAFASLEQAEYRVMADGPEGRTSFADVSIGQEGEVFVEIVLENGTCTLNGRTFGDDGSPTSGTEVVIEGWTLRCAAKTDEQGYYVFRGLPAGVYCVKARFGRGAASQWLGQGVELRQGEEARVDIALGGQGEVEGRLFLAGDAARAAAWNDGIYGLILREQRDSDPTASKNLEMLVDRVFELGNIPAGTYDVQAYCVVNVSPQPLVVPLTNSYLRKSARHARFESDPVTVLIQSNRRATIELTISEACSSLFPIPNAATVDRWAPVAR